MNLFFNIFAALKLQNKVTLWEKYFQDFINKLNDKCDIECIAKNVGCMLDYMNYTPRTLEEIISKKF